MSYKLDNWGGVYVAAWALWGEKLLLTASINEGYEFIQVIHRHTKGDINQENLIDAIANMEMICDQLKVMFKLIKPIDERKKEKIIQPINRINEIGREVRIIK